MISPRKKMPQTAIIKAPRHGLHKEEKVYSSSGNHWVLLEDTSGQHPRNRTVMRAAAIFQR